MGVELRRAVRVQYRAHPGWSAQLHYDNLVTLAESGRELGPVPSYWTARCAATKPNTSAGCGTGTTITVP